MTWIWLADFVAQLWAVKKGHTALASPKQLRLHPQYFCTPKSLICAPPRYFIIPLLYNKTLKCFNTKPVQLLK